MMLSEKKELVPVSCPTGCSVVSEDNISQNHPNHHQILQTQPS